MIRYSTNWMGPISLDWYVKNGYTERRMIQHPEGHDIEVDHIVTRWAGGRIDVYGTDEPYPEEIGVPIMTEEDWGKFGSWLGEFKSESILTLEQLVNLYEKNNPKITWWR